MKWKTTVVLLAVTVGVGAFISLYEIKQPSSDERSRRSLRLLDLSPESVTRIEILTSTAAIHLSRDGTQWRLEPQHARANEEAITQILDATARLRAQRLLARSVEKPLDLKSLGLDPAAAQVTLTADGKTVTLLLGEATPIGRGRYVEVAGRAQIGIISPSLFDLITQPPETFRDPMLLRFDTWMTDRVVVTTPTRAMTMSRAGMDWRISYRERDLVDSPPIEDRADRAALMHFLSQVAGLRMARVLQDTPQAEQISAWGFDAPSAEVALTVRTDPPASLTVFFGKPLPEEPSLLYAKRSDEPSLYAVPASAVELFLLDPNTLRSRACLELFASEVTAIEVMRETDGWRLERTDGVWRSVSDTKLETGGTPPLVSDTKLEAGPVDAFLNALADVRLLEFADERPQDLGRYGLAPPRPDAGDSRGGPAGTISVWTSNNPEAPQRLLVGSAVEGSTTRYGRIAGREPVVTLPDIVTSLLTAPLSQFQPPPAPAAPEPAPEMAPDAASPPAPQ